jgi:hypothetical protein
MSDEDLSGAVEKLRAAVERQEAEQRELLERLRLRAAAEPSLTERRREATESIRRGYARATDDEGGPDAA